MTQRMISLSDHGILPNTGADCSAALQAFFDGLTFSGETGICVQFAPGMYHIFTPVYIRNAANLTLLGNGASVIAHFDPTAPISANNDVFHFNDGSDLVLQDFYFDTDNPIGAAGRITAIDAQNHTADLQIYDEFPVTGYEHFCATNSFDEQGSPDYALHTYCLEPQEEEWTMPDGTKTTRLVGLPYDVIGDHLVRLHLENTRHFLRPGHQINIRYEMYGNTVLTFTSCSRVLLKNVVIFSAASFGLAIAPRSQDFTLDHFSIRVPQGSTRLKAANADGIHALGMSGTLTLKDCRIESLGDDPLNIHGMAGGVHALDTDKRTLSMVWPYRHTPHPLPAHWALPGDRILVYDSDTFAEKGSFIIDSVDENNCAVYRDLTGNLAVGDTLANSAYFASLHVDNCDLRNTRARGLLVQTQNVLIENCRISGMSLAAMLFAPDMRVWWEMGPCKNVEIRGNTIEHCAHIPAPANQGAIIFKACHDGTGTEYETCVHENIFIHHNRFVNIPQSGIFISSARNVRIEANEFCNCCSRPQSQEPYAVYDIAALNCENVTLRGNVSSRGEDTLVCLHHCR